MINLSSWTIEFVALTRKLRVYQIVEENGKIVCKNMTYLKPNQAGYLAFYTEWCRRHNNGRCI